MEKLQSFHYPLLAAGFTLAVLSHAQDQSGFISIDCGIEEGHRYTDKNTGLEYVSDQNFTDTGTPGRVSSEFITQNLDQQFYSVRSFPEGKRNCYALAPPAGEGNAYLIRARFMYGNYDNLSKVPEFDLYLGLNHWETIILDEASSTFSTEIIHVPSTDNIFVCLLKRDQGTPFISSLELRPLNSEIYQTRNFSESLVLQGRYDLGSTSGQSVRYPDDIYDRIWMPQINAGMETLMLDDGQNLNANDFRLPQTVMRTAVRPVNDDEDLFYWEFATDPNFKYYVYLHFAEVEVLDNQIREFNIYENEKWVKGPLILDHLDVKTVNTTSEKGGRMKITEIRKTGRSDLPPILNAIEIYVHKEFSAVQTHPNDVMLSTRRFIG